VHLAQLRRRRGEIEEQLRARIVVVSFEPAAELAAFARQEGLPFPVLSDPDRRAYSAFGLAGRASLRRLYTPGTLLAYLQGFFRGKLPRLPGRRDDTHQLGGDVIMSREGQVIFKHPSHDPADRPSIEDIKRALKGLFEGAGYPGEASARWGIGSCH
jgi:hypothetical protein